MVYNILYSKNEVYEGGTFKMVKKKKCPNCGEANDEKNFCFACGTEIKNVIAREACWIVLQATATGFSPFEGQYESLELLIEKNISLAHLVNRWLALCFVEDIVLGTTMNSLKQYYVTGSRVLRDSTQKTYLLTDL